MQGEREHDRMVRRFHVVEQSILENGLRNFGGEVFYQYCQFAQPLLRTGLVSARHRRGTDLLLTTRSRKAWMIGLERTENVKMRLTTLGGKRIRGNLLPGKLITDAMVFCFVWQ